MLFSFRNSNLQNDVLEDKVVVVVGHRQLYVLQDEFVDHDVVPDDGVNQLLVEGSFLAMKSPIFSSLGQA